MTYTKPTLSALDLHVDVASCKPAPPERPCPGVKVNNLCFAVKTVTVIEPTGGNAPVAVTGPALPTTGDGLPLLP